MWRRMLWWLQRNREREDLDEEIQAHLAIEAREQSGSGVSPDAAEREARRAFGNVTRVAEDTREVWSIRWLDPLWADTRHAVRRLWRTPRFTLAALATLAIGIGANTAIFGVVDGVLLRPLSFPEPERLVSIWHDAPGITGLERIENAPSHYFTYRDHNETFEQVGLWRLNGFTATGLAEPEQLLAVQATHGTLDALAVPPMLGRWFTEEDDMPGAPQTVILSQGYWQRAFGGDREVIGKVLRIDDEPREIVGVLPASFRFPSPIQPQIYLPLQLDRAEVFLGDFSYDGLVRLKPGITLAEANADVGRMLEIWLNEWPPFPGVPMELFRNAGFAPDVMPLKSEVVGSIGNLLWVLMGTLGLVLLIACANVANLLLVRTDDRRQELAIRAALGAGWSRIGRELLTESVVLSLAGGAVGLSVAWAGLRVLLTYVGTDLPRAAEVAIDLRALAFAFAASCASGVLFGLIPVARYAGPRIAGSLRGGGRTLSQSRERHRARNALVVVQVALALVLLVGSGLMIRTFLSLRAVDPGFDDPDHVQTFRLAISPAEVPDPEQVMRTEQEILDRIAAIPGVDSAAVVSSAPLDGFLGSNPVYARDRTYAEEELPALHRYKFVSPGSFETLGMPIVAGRDYTWVDLYDLRPVAIVSESLARELWGDAASAIGTFVRPLPTLEWKEVVGVVGDVADDGVDQPAPTIAYWPAYNEGYFGPETIVRRAIAYVVRTERAATESFLAEVRQAVWSVNASLPLSLVRTLGEVYQDSMVRTSYTLILLAIAGAMALLLGVVGIYGVVAYSVAQRTREVGIRMALGAEGSHVQGMFVRHALSLVGIGAAIGLASAVGVTRLMSSLLFGVSALDPVTYAAVAVVIGLAAALAAYVPARRATRVDPLGALHAE